MRIIKKFSKQLKIDYNLETPYVATNINLNQDLRNIVIRDIISIEFNNLYPVLLVLFHEENIFKINDDIVKRINRYIFHKKELSFTEMQTEKKWINYSLYTNELKVTYPILFDLFRQYMNMIYQELISKNSDKWIYLDCDVIYFKSLPIVNIQDRALDAYLPYSMQKYDLGAFLANKKYILSDREKGTKHRGFSQKQIDGLVANSELKNIQAVITDEIRDLKLNDLINGLS